MTAPMTNGYCVCRALSTMRLALGYAEAAPLAFVDDSPRGRDGAWILAAAPVWFPEHEVRVFCNGAYADEAEDTAVFAGDHIPLCFDSAEWLLAYGYENASEDKSDDSRHFVIGEPDFRLSVPIVVAVRITAGV